MQDRINELARKHLFCDAHGYYGGRSARIESFAQAIARECAEIVEDHAEALRAMNSKHEAAQVEMAEDEIRARFGIAKE